MSKADEVKKEEYRISIRPDNRREKDSGKYPIKLRVYGKVTQKEKWYSLGIDLTVDEFEGIYFNVDNINFRGTKKEIKTRLHKFYTRADDVAKQMTVFDFATFEKNLFRKSTDKNNVQYHFNLVINKNKENNKIGTAESYNYTLKSLAQFSEDKKKTSIDKLTFQSITVDWLNEYENFMLAKGRSYTTIGIYTRTLRVVFNNAIDNKDIHEDIYPFGKKKYQIPRTKKVKKALNSVQLKTLFEAEVLNVNEAKAKDFWFFSYACNGMNLKDIALLKYSDIKEDKFSYYRAKTFDKTVEKTTITIHLTDFTNSIISKYGNKNKNGNVFSIIDIKEDSITQYKKIKNFTRYINDHIKRIAKANDLTSDISFYWARHSFTTNSIRKGASMEFISEALNHSDLNVTKNYFAGFDDETKKEFAHSVMDF
jgi:site-specific recombinase XerD